MIFVWTGGVSAFEELVQNQAAYPRPFRQILDDETTAKYIMERMVPVPRLVLMVRNYPRRPTKAVANRILELAKYIDDSAVGRLIEAYLSRSTSVVETSAEFNPELIPKSFAFDSLRIFMLTVLYYTYRVIISGLIQRLFILHIASQDDFDHVNVEAQDVQASEAIVMCTQYALDLDYDPPLPALRMGGPIALAYGSWDRLQGRLMQDKDTSVIYQEEDQVMARATGMKKLLIRVSQQIGELWGWFGISEEYVRNGCQAFSGDEFVSPFGPSHNYCFPMNSRDVDIRNLNDPDLDADGCPVGSVVRPTPPASPLQATSVESPTPEVEETGTSQWFIGTCSHSAQFPVRPKVQS